MTVAQLKKELEKYPDNMDVFLGERMTEFTYGLLNSVHKDNITFFENDIEREDLPELEKLWWRCHDHNGELKNIEPIPGIPVVDAEPEKKWTDEDMEKFFVWKDENRWYTFTDGKWNYTFEHGTSLSKGQYEKNYRKTTKELHELYLFYLKQSKH